MLSKYRVLIIGAGGQGSEADQPGSGNEFKIISFGHAFSLHPGFTLCGFIDKDTTKAQKASDIWKSQYASNVICDTAMKNIDVAIVAIPDDKHFDILKQLAEYPLKLVVCEKPICTDLNEAREIVALYKAKNIALMVDYTRRFIPHYWKLYGDTPIYGLCQFNRGWLHTGTHAIDFFNMIGCKNYDIHQVNADFRVWNIDVIYPRWLFKEIRIGNQPIPDYFNSHLEHLAENANNFLQGKEPLKCTGEMALKSLETCFELMKGSDKKQCQSEKKN